MNYAVISDGVVVNLIVAESKELAETATGKTCILSTDENPAHVGGTHDGTSFIAPPPYPSWILNSDKEWTAPTPMPMDEGTVTWDEKTLSWVPYVEQ
jgi:hypothetical protein